MHTRLSRRGRRDATERLTHEVVRERLRRFLLEELDWRGASPGLGDDTPLLNNVLDSLGIVELVELIEREFGVSVADDDLTAENFGTVRGLVAFVAGPNHATSG